jgi:predicted permease
MDEFLNDFRHSLRIFLQSPAFTITSVAALALGIGANTAIFSVIDTVLLRPVPYPDPERVVAFLLTFPEGTGRGVSATKFNLWREQTSTFQDVTAYRYSAVNLTGVENPEQVQAGRVSSSYFRLFGLPIARGRGFTTSEDRPMGNRVAVLADALWKHRFGADPHIIGKRISLSGDSYEIVGVVAAGFKTEVDPPVDVYLPFQIDPNSTEQAHYFIAAGRLKPGITLGMAKAQLQLVANEFRRKYPDSGAMGPKDGFSVLPMQQALAGDVGPSLFVLLGAVSLVPLIACSNVANLLLVRATGRKREIAIRAAMGAGRGRIIRQLLTESIVLSVAGGALGLALGFVSIRALLAVNPGDIPRIGSHGANIAIDWRVLVFTVLVTLVTGILFGLIPAFQASRADLSITLKESGGRSGTSFRQNKVRSLLVIAEIALALVLLVGAGLLIRTLAVLRSVNPGFDAHHVLTMRMSLSDARFGTAAAQTQLVRDGVERIRALPGVISASAGCCVPLNDAYGLPFIVVGRPLEGPNHGGGEWLTISPSYFDLFKIPILRGRAFTDRDEGGAAPVVVINQAMAKQFWPNSDPLNDRLIIGKGVGPAFEEPPRQIVGIVGDVRDEGLNRDPPPTMYIPASQVKDELVALNRNIRSMAWFIRTRTDPLPLSAAIQKELQQSSSGLPVASVRSMDEVVQRSTAREDFNMLVLTVFAGVALLLASIGVYGLMAYSVEQRTQEIGIRMALGAEAGDVRRLIVVQGMGLALIGVVTGVGAAFGLTRFIASFLFGVTTRDPVVFVGVPLLLILVALAAVWFPSLRATRIDPMDALRYE